MGCGAWLVWVSCALVVTVLWWWCALAPVGLLITWWWLSVPVVWPIVRSSIVVSGVVCLLLVPYRIVPVVAWCKLWPVTLVMSPRLVIVCRAVYSSGWRSCGWLGRWCAVS
jgi:hypothetical protein